jgi:hypothetical protein
MMNWKESEMKKSFPNQGTVPGMCLVPGGSEKTHEKSQVVRCPGRIYKSRMLPLDEPVQYEVSFWLCDVEYKHGDCANR